MWPDIFLPGNTRPGVWRWPSEPGARCDSELPWVASPMRKFQRLMVPWKPLPLVTPWTSTIWPDFEDVGLDLAADGEVADLVGFHAQLPQATTGFDLGLGQVAGGRLVDSEARFTPAVTCTAL
jgi:hypothetical protein